MAGNRCQKKEHLIIALGESNYQICPCHNV
jgi:hypothetical protein